MNEICQLAEGITQLRYLAFSLTGLIGFLGLAGAYIYLGPVKMIIRRLQGIIFSIFGLLGAGVIGALFFANRLLC